MNSDWSRQAFKMYKPVSRSGEYPHLVDKPNAFYDPASNQSLNFGPSHSTQNAAHQYSVPLSGYERVDSESTALGHINDFSEEQYPDADDQLPEMYAEEEVSFQDAQKAYRNMRFGSISHQDPDREVIQDMRMDQEHLEPDYEGGETPDPHEEMVDEYGTPFEQEYAVPVEHQDYHQEVHMQHYQEQSYAEPDPQQDPYANPYGGSLDSMLGH